MDAVTDADEKCTGRYVAGRLRKALDEIKSIATTGRNDLDAELLIAEQALRRVIVAANQVPE